MPWTTHSVSTTRRIGTSLLARWAQWRLRLIDARRADLLAELERLDRLMESAQHYYLDVDPRREQLLQRIAKYDQMLAVRRA